MGMYVIQCALGFSTTYTNPLTQVLERHASAMGAGYRESQFHWLSALSTLHDAVDAALADDAAAAAHHLLAGKAELAACNDRLTAFGHALVELRSDLFDRRLAAATTEPLLAREPFFATLDYDSLYRELAGQGAALPDRTFWEEAATRTRDGGARGACRLIERHLRELQSDLHIFISEVEAASHLPLRPMADALHGSFIAVSRVMTGYTRLITTCGYVSFMCDCALHAFEQSQARSKELLVLAAS